MRKPFQGVLNIIRFNWHFYVIALVFLCALLILNPFVDVAFRNYISIVLITVFTIILSSLTVSFYVYDLSNLYELDWLADDKIQINIANISAGFDETSHLLELKFKNAKLTALDFYNPETHTEVSIKRARKAYPAYPNTIKINSNKINLPHDSFDIVFVILAAHEIRNDDERTLFFKEATRILKSNGQIIVVEHLRDFANFAAYNIGIFHFLSKSTWLKTFESSNLKIIKTQKITPFITVFTLQQHGITS